MLTEFDAQIILAYADSGMKAYPAAPKVYTSANNFRYHLEKVKRETGLDPHNFYDLIELVEIADNLLHGDKKEGAENEST